MGSTLTYKLAQKSQYYFSIAKKNPNIFSSTQNTIAVIFIADCLST